MNEPSKPLLVRLRRVSWDSEAHEAADEIKRLNRELAERDFVLALMAACLEQAWIETSRIELRLGNALARATLELREMGSLGE